MDLAVFVAPIAVMFAALFGATVGSFLNVCIWRLPREGLTPWRPGRSHCPNCGMAIAWHDNVPVVSWILLRARCRSCKSSISARYISVEILTAVFFGVIAYQHLTPGDFRWAEFVVLAILISSLIVASFVDIDLRIIPDEITLPGMMLTPWIALAVPGLHAKKTDVLATGLIDLIEKPLGWLGARLPENVSSGPGAWGLVAAAALVGAGVGLYGFHFYFIRVHPDEPHRLRDGTLGAVLLATLFGVTSFLVVWPEHLASARVESFTITILGMAAGAGLILMVGILGSLVFRKEAMGFGDVKLMGLIGGYAAWAGVVGGFTIACFLGSAIGIWRLVRYRNRYLWFGPFLSLGSVLVILFPDAMRSALRWYLDLFR